MQMRKSLLFLITLCALSMVGCNPYPPMEKRDNIQGSTEEKVVEDMVEEKENKMTEKQPLTIMVDGQLYYDIGRSSDQKERCGIVDGTIETTVEENQIPTQNNESNFGTGYQYQTGAKVGTIDVLINGEWWIFEARETPEDVEYIMPDTLASEIEITEVTE